MAAVALRRWRSFPRPRPRSRRAGRRSRASFDARVADLANGVCATFEGDRRLVGQLMADERQVATVLGEVVRASTRGG